MSISKILRFVYLRENKLRESKNTMTIEKPISNSSTLIDHKPNKVFLLGGKYFKCISVLLNLISTITGGIKPKVYL